MNLIKSLFRMEQKETMAQVAERLKAQGIRAFEEKNDMDGNGVYHTFLGTDVKGYPGRGDMVFRRFLKQNIFGDINRAYIFNGQYYIPYEVKTDIQPPALPVDLYDRSRMFKYFAYKPTEHDRANFDAIGTGSYNGKFTVIMLDPSRYICPGPDRVCMDAENGFWAFSERGVLQLMREMRVRRIDTTWMPPKM